MAERAVAATGLLAQFMDAGYIGLADFHTAERLAWHAGDASNQVAKLAFALTVRALRSGSVCLDLEQMYHLAPESDIEVRDAPDVEWPTIEAFDAALRSSPFVSVGEAESGKRPLRLVEGQLYLERYWRAERDVATMLVARRDAAAPAINAGFIERRLNDRQRAAVLAVGHHPTTVITGGPGTGKTSAVAGILRAYPQLARVALAAPTGKAAARLEEAVSRELASSGEESPMGTTLHRLLGMHPARPNEPRHHAGNPLPHDLVIVDETSMASLTMMRQLLAALRPQTRLVLIGDRDQLASIDAGAVLADLVDAERLLGVGAVTELTTNYRFTGSIGDAARAIRDGDVEACLAAFEGDGSALLVEADASDGLAGAPQLASALLNWAEGLHASAVRGDAVAACEQLDRHRLLCAHREGPAGAGRWNSIVRRWLAGHVSQEPDIGGWFAGQPLLLTQNSEPISGEQVWNGDTGVIVASPLGLRAAISRASAPLLVAPQLLDGVSDVYAMTIHKSQGSQFDHVSVVLPPIGSPLLTRELLYTALTRAKDSVTMYGSRDALVAAIQTPARRASGLAR